MSAKTSFIQQTQEVSNALSKASNDIVDLVETYFDRGYNSGGAAAITDGDASAFGLTAANVGSFITMAQQLTNFFTNQTVTEADYDATLNVMRTDI